MQTSHILIAFLEYGSSFLPPQDRKDGVDMLSMGFILESLKNNIIRMQIKTGTLLEVDRIAFAVPGEHYAANTLLLCEGSALPELLSGNYVAPGATILSAGNSEEVCLPNSLELNIITTSLSQIELYQLFSNALQQATCWTVHFLESILNHNDLESVLSYAFSVIHADILYLAPDGRLVSSHLAEESDDPFVKQVLETNGMSKELPADWVEKPYYGVQPSQGFARYSSRKSNYLYHLYHIANEKQAIATLLIVMKKDRPRADVQSLAFLIGRCIKKALHTGQVKEYNKHGELYSLFQKIVEGTVSTQEVKRQLKLAPHPLLNFCAIGIVEFEGRLPGAIPFGHVMRQLSDIFPKCNMLVYDSAIVIFITFDQRNLNLSFDGTGLSNLLEQHGAYFGISNATRNRAMLRTLYLQCRDTIRLAKVLRTDPEERIFLHEDYAVYCIIDLCVRSFQDIHRHDDLIYLIHPSIVEISRYDIKNNNNLLDVLYHYLLNGCNLVKTAKALYMHRNTVVNKVNKLVEIIGSDLENGEFQQRLLFSCQFIRYIKLYLEKTVTLN
jgi:hypothetical protein